MAEKETEENKTVNKNILKSRDDPNPTIFTYDEKSASDDKKYILCEGQRCSWAKPDEPFEVKIIRERIEPWLTALCQSEHLSLLIGSGLNLAMQNLATGTSKQGMASTDFGEFQTLIDSESTQSAKTCRRGTSNIEDQLRVANELLRGLEILGSQDKTRKTQADTLQKMISSVMTEFTGNILNSEYAIMTGKAREEAFNYLVSFLMSFASRSGTRDRLQIFTTNYDRLIEMGAEVAGMHLLDRFVGSISPVFRSSRLDIDMHYNPPGIRGEPRYLEGVARFSKLHGSLDWVECNREIRRLGIPLGATKFSPYLEIPGIESINAMNVMIYPNASKDRETAAYPYVELFRDFAAAICRPNHTLVTYGYSFGDEHINRVIRDMLNIPSTHLVIISYDDPLGRIIDTYKQIGRHAQISLIIGNQIGDFKTLVDQYLPKPAIDRTTFKMAELLRARLGANSNEDNELNKPDMKTSRNKNE